MAKRRSKSFASRQSKMKLETLEARQLLATVIGAGDELNSDVQIPGKAEIFDQVLMTGSSVTVDADANQWTRVAFIDGDGDITQVEFTGAGTMTVSLEDFSGPAAPVNYDQPGTEYVSGNAAITFNGTDATSHVSIYSLGTATSAAAPEFFIEGPNTHQANIKNITIVSDPQGGVSRFGSIFAGNAVFGGDSGLVGVQATGVEMNGATLAIGGINATLTGVPTLKISEDSLVPSISVIGGNVTEGLLDADIKNVNTMVFSDGIFNDGSPAPALIQPPGVIPGGVDVVTVSQDAEFDMTGATQGSLDDFFQNRTFTGNVVVSGDVPEFLEIRPEGIEGNITFQGAFNGILDIGAGGVTGNLTFEKGFSGSQAGDVDGVVGALIVGGTDNAQDVKTDLVANSFGSVTVYGNVAKEITADAGGMGNVMVGGNVTDTIWGRDGIGNVDVDGNVEITDSVFLRTGADVGDGQNRVGSIGDVDVAGKVVITGDYDDDNDGGTADVNSRFIDMLDNGIFGTIMMNSGRVAGDISSGDINVGDKFISSAPASVTIYGAEDTGNDLTIGGAAAHDLSGSKIVTVSVVGSGVTFKSDNTVDKASDVNTNGDILGDLTVTGADTITVDQAVGGDINLTTIDDLDRDGKDDLDGDDNETGITINFAGAGTNVGDVTLTTGSIFGTTLITSLTGDNFGSLTVNTHQYNQTGDVGATGDKNSIGDISIALVGKDPDANIDGQIKSGKSVGNVSITGAKTIDINTGGATDEFIQLKNEGGLTSFLSEGTLSIHNPLVTDIATNDKGTVGDLTFGALSVDTLTEAFVDVQSIGAVSASGDVTVADDKFLIGKDSIGDLSFAGKLDMNSGGAGLGISNGGSFGSVTVGGTLKTSTTAGIKADGFGPIALGGLDSSGMTAGNFAIQADDGGSSLDTIESLTIAGQVKGDAGEVDVRASAIGDLTIEGALTDATAKQTLVESFNVLVAPNGQGDSLAVATAEQVGNSEQVALDGSNLGDYSIGNIKVASVLSAGFGSTELFKGDSSFIALGAIGNITITSDPLQSKSTSQLFDAAGDAAWFVVGQGQADLVGDEGVVGGGDDVVTLERGTLGIDPNDTANGRTTADMANLITDGEVTIGNVSVFANQSQTGGDRSGVDNIGGDLAGGESASIDGFAVLSNVLTTDGGGDIYLLDDGSGSAQVEAIDGDVDGKIGSVLIEGSSIFPLYHSVGAGTVGHDEGGAAPDEFVSGIVATKEIADIQSQGKLETGTVVVGDDVGTGDAVIEENDQFLVFIV